MKKIFSILFVLVFLFGMTQLSWAHTNTKDGLVLAGEDDSMTVFVQNNLPIEEQKHIAAFFLNGNTRDEEQPRNILCTLFGHKNTESTTVTITHHAYSTSPKCLQNTYTTYTCSRCGNVETVLTESIRISTCHG